MRHHVRFLLTALLVLGFVEPGHTIPQLINFQGVLTDGGGTPITVAATVEFRIWDLSIGGAELWMESQSVTPDANGSFSVLLGSVTPIPDSALSGDEAYLGVTISPDPELSPRSRLVAAAYAFRVGTIEGATAGAMSGDLVLKPTGGLAQRAQDPGDPQIILVSTPGDSLFFGPADVQVFRAVDDLNGEYMIAEYDPGKGPLFGIRVDGTEYVEHAVTSSTFYTGTGARDITAFSKKMEVGIDGAFVYGATDADTLTELRTTGLRVRDASGNVSEIRSTTVEFKNASGETVAKIGDQGIQVFSTSGAQRGPQIVDTIFSFYPPTRSLQIGLNNATVGLNTIAVGTDNTVFGSSSMAIGSNNVARGFTTVALGSNNIADSGGATVSGGTDNQAGNLGATIGGGLSNLALGDAATVAGGFDNEASLNNAFVGGGFTNTAGGVNSTIAGGANNNAPGGAATIAGGEHNAANGDWSFIGGGDANYTAANSAAKYGVVGGGYADTLIGESSVIAGGRLNKTFAPYAAVGGGENNHVTWFWGTIPGGRDNRAAQYAFAAGRRAKAAHVGSFVWGDSTDSDVTSSATNQFKVRASGGTVFYSDTALTSGVVLVPGGGSWASVSDRNAKEHIRPVDGADILSKIAQLDIARWNYKTQDASVEHIGPMAQDVYALFGVGDNNTTIATVDPDGIALAAIKELGKRTDELAAQSRRVDELETEIRELRQIIDDLVSQR